MAAKFDLVVAAKTVGAASIKRLGNSMQGVQGKVKNLRMSMSGLNKAFATLGLILSAGAFVRMVKGSIDAADAFGKLEIQTGIAANTLQAYVNAGKIAGVEQATLEKGLKRLAQSMREADQGVATYKDAFDDLGISVRNTDGNLKTNQQILGEISDAFTKMEDGVTKTAIAMEIFGRSGASMVNLLNNGKASLEEFNFEVSDNFAQNAEYFNDQLTIIGFRAEGLAKQLTDHLLPSLNNLADMFREINVQGEGVVIIFQAIELTIETIAAALFTAYKGFESVGLYVLAIVETLDKIVRMDFKGAGERIKQYFTDTWEDAMKSFGKDGTFSRIYNGTAENIKEDNEVIGNSLEKTFGKQMITKLDTFKKSIKGINEAMADVVVKGIKGMEDALVDFVMKGTLSFRNLANSIITDMVRIAIQQTITLPFTTFVEGIFKNADGNAFMNGKVQKYAYGGVVNRPTLFPMANGMGLMGEAGAEAILPLRRGSNGKLGVQATGGGVGNIVVNVDASGSTVEGDEQGGKELGRVIAVAIQSEIINQKRPGGLLA